MLDESILSAKPSDPAFALRAFFGALGPALDTDVGFCLASALNFYFRASMEEEEKLRIGIEASRVYYQFCREQKIEDKQQRAVSPLLAELMSSELSRLRLVSVDNDTTFNSERHERDRDASPHESRITSPTTFLALVEANDRVRIKAGVLT